MEVHRRDEACSHAHVRTKHVAEMFLMDGRPAGLEKLRSGQGLHTHHSWLLQMEPRVQRKGCRTSFARP